MNAWHLATREILRRPIPFLAGVFAVVVAAGVLIGQAGTLTQYDRKTDELLEQKRVETQKRVSDIEADVKTRVAKLDDEMRRITKGLGFNVYILPKDVDMTDYLSAGFASKFMPEAYVTTLANSKIVTVRHLLPILVQKAKWPEYNGRSFLLIGTRGEVPLVHKSPKTPLIQPVADGEIVLGYELWRTLSLKVGDPVKLMGQNFTVKKCHPERGDKDDISAWLPLATAQNMLNLEGKINTIYALECACAFADLAKVRAEITAILPETQVKEFGSIALTRAEARRQAADKVKTDIAQAKQNGLAALAQEQDSRAQLRDERQRFGAVLLPLVIGACVVWVALLSYLNVRHRRQEIGILRALGLRASVITRLFVLRAGLTGLLGGIIGTLISLAVGGVLAGPVVIITVLVAAPIVGIAAGWPPAVLAGLQDPASILQQE